MKKLVSWILTVVMIASLGSIPALAEESAIRESSGLYFIDANGDQAELNSAFIDRFIQADGLYFKDMNGNGTLDVYEDYRADIEDRIADLLSQMTIEEEVGLLFQPETSGNSNYPQLTEALLYSKECPFALEDGGPENNFSTYYFVTEFHVNSFLDNANGTPDAMAARHNQVQKVAEEFDRLSVPVTFTCDRQFNAWGGYTDLPRNAMGATNDNELTAKLWEYYGKAMASVGYHVSLNPTSMQLNSANGEDVARVAEKTTLELTSYQNENVRTCSKHFMFGGMRDGLARMTDYYGNQGAAWKAAIDAGTGWIMTNAGYGFNGVTRMDYDEETMRYLRETLGYQGVVLTDIWSLSDRVGPGHSNNNITSVLNDGTDVNTLSTVERYARMLSCNVDVFLSELVVHGVEFNNPITITNYPDAIVEGVNTGVIDKALVDRAATRVLRSKFELGQFETPYRDPARALSLNASEEYISNPWNIATNAELDAARNPEIVELERQLMASSATLLRNDDQILPLAKETKVFFSSNNLTNDELYRAAIAEKGTLVENIEEADVVVADIIKIDDSAEQMITDATDAQKKLIVICNCVKPDENLVMTADAVLYLVYSTRVDHGSSAGGFTAYTGAPVIAELLYGERQPEGVVANEIGRTASDENWIDLPNDTGVSNYVRMIMLGMMQASENNAAPSNLSKALFPSNYGMRYGQDGQFRFDSLVAAPAPDGQSATLDLLVWNCGEADGLINVEAICNETVAAKQIVAVSAGSWRIVEMEIALAGAGEYTVKVGDLSTVLTVK